MAGYSKNNNQFKRYQAYAQNIDDLMIHLQEIKVEMHDLLDEPILNALEKSIGSLAIDQYNLKTTFHKQQFNK